MALLEYEVLYDDLSNSGGMELKELARLQPRPAAKLANYVERFITVGTTVGHRVAPEKTGALEVYLLPMPQDFDKILPPLALVRIDHSAKTIELIKVMRAYTPSEGELWEQLVVIGRQAIGEA